MNAIAANDRPDTPRLSWIAAIAGAYALAGGTSSFLGWALDIRRLTDWYNNGISIQPNAALCVALSGLALLLLCVQRRRLAAACGTLVALIGGATFLEWITGLTFGIDSLLMFGRQWGRTGVLVPGRMGPPGSLSWTLIGTALLLTAWSPPARRFAPALALLTLALGLLSITGYLYGASILYTMPRLTVIALQTATFIAAVSLGIIACSPDRQPMRLLLENSTAGLLARRVLPVLIIVPLILGWLRVWGQEAGLFDTAFGTTARTIIEMVFLISLLWWGLSIVSRHERSRRAAAERNSAILGSITDAFFTLDKDWRFAFVNQEAVRRFKMPREQILGGEIWALFPQAVGNESYVQLHRAMDQRISVEYDVYYAPWKLWFHDKAYPTADGGLAVYSQDITTSKQMEETSLKLAQRLRLITDAAPALISYIDSQGIYRFVNKGYEDWFSRPKEEIVGKHMRVVLGDAAMDRLGPHVAAALSGIREAFDAEVPYLHGGTRFVHAEYVPDLQPDGSACGFYVLVTDITQRKQAEANLRKITDEQLRQRDFLDRLVEASPVAIAVVRGLELQFVTLNAAYRSIAGVKHRPDVGRTYLEVFPEAAALGAAEQLRNVIRTGQPWKVRDYETPIGDRPLTWWEGECLPLTNAAGAVDSILIVTWDVTERKQAELALRESEERFRAIADNIPQLAWMAQPGTSGQATWFNKAWLDYTGTTLEQNQGSGWQAVHHPDHSQRVIRKFEQHVQACLDWEDTFPLRGKDGQYRWFLSRMNVIRDQFGNPARIFGTNTDITAQQELQQALRESDRRKDEFLATLAHELRNPLAPIRNALSFLKLAPGDPELFEQTRGMMERQLGHMVQLIDDLLDVSRISRGKLELRLGRVELASVIHQAVETCRPLVEDNRHAVTLALPPQPVYLTGDPVRLAQIFSNLLNNSCKYTPPAGQIGVTAQREGSDVVVAVRDTGVGIPPDKLATIFEMFSQVDQTLERSQGGLGIGLTLVKRLVELHGGSILARSDGLGQGSEFVVRLPVLVEQPPPQHAEAIVDLPAATAKRRILVVDDNRDSADSLARLLKLTGNQTHTAYDGQAAVEAAAALRPDVILLDIGLPKLNGYDACRSIRQQTWGGDLAIFALTGWGQDEDRRKSREAGFDGHLVKPVDHAILMQLLAGLSPTGR